MKTLLKKILFFKHENLFLEACSPMWVYVQHVGVDISKKKKKKTDKKIFPKVKEIFN